MPESEGNGHFRSFTAIFTGDARSPTGEYCENPNFRCCRAFQMDKRLLIADAETSTTLRQKRLAVREGWPL
jgi:hypothetical protein